MQASVEDLAPLRPELDGEPWVIPTEAPKHQIVTVKIEHTVEHALLLEALKELLPAAKISSRLAFADEDSNLSAKSSLKTLFVLAKQKVDLVRDCAGRLNDWPARLSEWRSKHSVQVQALFGSLEVKAADRTFGMLGLDGNSAICSIWATQGDSALSAVLSSDQNVVECEAALKALLQLCATTSTSKRDPRTRESITKAEMKAIADRANRLNTPLPPGFAFDGRSYVDSFGARSRERPDLEDLANLWLQDQNNAIKETNLQVH